eukprot:1252447-Amphidinium_carterae.1
MDGLREAQGRLQNSGAKERESFGSTASSSCACSRSSRKKLFHDHSSSAPIVAPWCVCTSSCFSWAIVELHVERVYQRRWKQLQTEATETFECATASECCMVVAWMRFCMLLGNVKLTTKSYV